MIVERGKKLGVVWWWELIMHRSNKKSEKDNKIVQRTIGRFKAPITALG